MYPRSRPISASRAALPARLRPRAKSPAVEAEVYDGTGHLTLVWLGRRSLRGVEAGRMIVARGRVTFPHGDPVIYNPEYELLPVSAS